MDKLVDKIVGLGVPGLVLLVIMSISGYTGAVAITSTLALLGGPFGMLGGIAVLGILSMMSRGLVEYGFEQIFRAVVDKFNAEGKSKQDIVDEIDRYPISKSLKLKIRAYLQDDWGTKKPDQTAQGFSFDIFKQASDALTDVWQSQIPILKSGMEQLQNATIKYPQDNASTTKNVTEKEIRDQVAAQIPHSQVEVSTLSGRVDIVTDQQIIEVKNVKYYKHAIGQILSYSHYYPHHQKCIYLFGKARKHQRRLIESEAATAGVVVLFHDYSS